MRLRDVLCIALGATLGVIIATINQKPQTTPQSQPSVSLPEGMPDGPGPIRTFTLATDLKSVDNGLFPTLYEGEGSTEAYLATVPVLIDATARRECKDKPLPKTGDRIQARMETVRLIREDIPSPDRAYHEIKPFYGAIDCK